MYTRNLKELEIGGLYKACHASSSNYFDTYPLNDEGFAIKNGYDSNNPFLYLGLIDCCLKILYKNKIMRLHLDFIDSDHIVPVEDRENE